MRWVVTNDDDMLNEPMAWNPAVFSSLLAGVGMSVSFSATEPSETIEFGEFCDPAVRLVVEVVVPYDPNTKSITGETYNFSSGIVTATPIVSDIANDITPPKPYDATAQFAIQLRKERDQRISDIFWRVERNITQVAGNITPDDDLIHMSEIYTYLQALRDMPETYPNIKTFEEYQAIVWPTAPVPLIEG